jgi:hypothetical protein
MLGYVVGLPFLVLVAAIFGGLAFLGIKLAARKDAA